MKHIFILYLLLAPFTSTLYCQGADLSGVLESLTQELVNVDTEKYRYEQRLLFDAEKPWRVTITINEIYVKKEKSEITTYYLNLADLDARLINIETDKEEQLVIMKCQKRQDFIRLTDEEGDVSYESELQLWSPEIDKAKALRDLFRQATELAEKAWEADFAPGESLEDLNEWLAESVMDVKLSESTTTVAWAPNPTLTDLVELTIKGDDDDEVLVYKFSLADLAPKSLKLGVRKETVSVTAFTVNKSDLIQEEENGTVSGYESAVIIPVNGIEEAGRLIQVLEAAIPLARKIRAARMPNPKNLKEALHTLSQLMTSSKNSQTEIEADLLPTPLTTMNIRITDSDKGEVENERYVFDFGDLNAKEVALSVKGSALKVKVETIKGEDFIQRWEGEDDAEFEDEIAFPVNSIENSHKLLKILPYIIGQAKEIPVSAGDFTTIKKAIIAGSNEDRSQTIEQREDDCKWSFTQVEEGKKVEEILYEFNLYDLDPKRVSYDVQSKGVFLILPTLRKEETINVYENDEPSFTNIMEWKLNSLSDAKQLRVTIIQLIQNCTE